jgi:hypothetical protein
MVSKGGGSGRIILEDTRPADLRGRTYGKMRGVRRIALWMGALLVLVGIGAVVLLLRPASSATSTVDADVTVECSGGAAVDDATCRAWGDAILAEGAPTTTFEARDVVRLRLDRALFGFGGTCRAEWFLGRYPDDVAWSESVACADG